MRPRWSALAVLSLLAGSGVALADPEFQYLGYDDLGDGMYQHNYELFNPPEGAIQVEIYDIDWVWVGWQYGWVEVQTPNDWYYQPGPTSKFTTDDAPATVGWDALPGYSITAATPVVGTWEIQYTDIDHLPVCAGTAEFPIPEPSTALLLLAGLGFLRRR